MHLQPLYRSYDYVTGTEGLSVSDHLFEDGLCLPSGSDLREADQDRIIDLILSKLG
ncbi:MAG: hypothetical protein GXO91_10410 [FCB group bacterium]|nr:hypothetical protein [FCB group bacterium]